jgi:hypothetical protein
MQLTKNVSLFRLLTAALDEVFENRGEYVALGVVDYESLPHWNRFEPSFLEIVRRYLERVDHDVIGLADGGGTAPEQRQLLVCRTGDTVPQRSYDFNRDNGLTPAPVDSGSAAEGTHRVCQKCETTAKASCQSRRCR